jgi:hypothetical protein
MCSYQIIATKELLGFLSQGDGNKYSKMEALNDLLDRAAAVTNCGEPVTSASYCTMIHVTMTELAKDWNWHRGTVRNFILWLNRLGLISLDTSGKTFRIGVNFSEGGNPASQPLQYEENPRFIRMVCDFLGGDELVAESMNFINLMRGFYSSKPTESESDSATSNMENELLTAYFAYIISCCRYLQPYIPETVPKVVELFRNHCHRNLTILLHSLIVMLLAKAGGRQTDQYLVSVENPQKAAVCFESIWRTVRTGNGGNSQQTASEASNSQTD